MVFVYLGAVALAIWAISVVVHLVLAHLAVGILAILVGGTLLAVIVRAIIKGAQRHTVISWPGMTAPRPVAAKPKKTPLPPVAPEAGEDWSKRSPFSSGIPFGDEEPEPESADKVQCGREECGREVDRDSCWSISETVPDSSGPVMHWFCSETCASRWTLAQRRAG